jgi:hypothetical protein
VALTGKHSLLIVGVKVDIITFGGRCGLWKGMTADRNLFCSHIRKLFSLDMSPILRCLGKSLFPLVFNFLTRIHYYVMTVSRGFHSTGVKRMGGGHGHSEPEYMHAYHMYNLDKMKYQGLKMSLAVFSAFSIGVGVPVFAVIFQQKKTASG